MSFAKKIYDPVHGFIRLGEIEKTLIDSYVFQRLHYIHQLGVAYLVYPGATHTRFEHSLGVMEVASQIYDRIVLKYEQLKDPALVDYWRQIVRLAALCHDLGHLPFSHVAEKRLLGKEGHEKWTFEVLSSPFLQPIWDLLEQKYPDKKAKEDVIKVSIGEEKLREIDPSFTESSFSSWDRVMSLVITGDFFGADRIDYLLRDARCTGVSYGLFDYHQLIEMLRILPNINEGKEGLVLGVEENGIESCEALLLARHFMHKRVYQYPSVKAHAFHLARFMETFYAEEKPLDSLEQYLSLTDNEILVAAKKACKDPSHPGHLDALSLFERAHRFHAIELPATLQLQQLQELTRAFQIQEDAVDWNSSEQKKWQRFSFPILRKNQTVVDASQCSELQIPSFLISWLYVAPHFEGSLQTALEQMVSAP